MSGYIQYAIRLLPLCLLYRCTIYQYHMCYMCYKTCFIDSNIYIKQHVRRYHNLKHEAPKPLGFK